MIGVVLITGACGHGDEREATLATTAATAATTATPTAATTTVVLPTTTAPVSVPARASQGCSLPLVESAPTVAAGPPGQPPRPVTPTPDPIQRLQNRLRTRYSCWFTSVSLAPLGAAPQQDVVIHLIEDLASGEVESLRVESGLTVKLSTTRARVSLFEATMTLERTRQALAGASIRFSVLGIDVDGVVFVEVNSEADAARARGAIRSGVVDVRVTTPPRALG